MFIQRNRFDSLKTKFPSNTCLLWETRNGRLLACWLFGCQSVNPNLVFRLICLTANSGLLTNQKGKYHAYLRHSTANRRLFCYSANSFITFKSKSYVFFFLNKKERGTSCLTQSFSTLSLLPLLQCF